MHESQTKARVEEDVKGLLKIHEGLTYPELPEHQYLLSTSLSQTWAPRNWPMSSVEGLFTVWWVLERSTTHPNEDCLSSEAFGMIYLLRSLLNTTS